MKTNKKLLNAGTAAIITFSLGFVSTPASATPEVDETKISHNTLEDEKRIENNPHNDEQVNFTAKVLLSDKDSTETIDLSEENISLERFLTERGYEITDYRLINGDVIENDRIIQHNERVHLFKNDRTASFKKVSLKHQVETIETDELLVGETTVETEGKDGEALRTIITVSNSKNKSDDIVEEKLTIISAPVKKIILKGTREPAPEPVINTNANSNTSPSGRQYYSNNGMSRGGNAGKKELEVVQTDNSILKNVMAQVGKPYVWGASGPNAFDCSGLVYWAYHKNAGYDIPRTAKAIGMSSQRINDWGSILPGDILWTSGHIAIYVGEGKVVHAFNPRVGVVVDDLSYFKASGYSIGRLSK